MGLNRFAPKRDGNEGVIRAHFARYGWHTEQLSGKGMPDLLCWPPRTFYETRDSLSSSVLVDVKEPSGKPTPAQAEKWKALSAKGIPVYVARTQADVDAIVTGKAEPWGVLEAKPKRGRAKVKADSRKRAPRKVPFNEAMDALVPERRRTPRREDTPIEAQDVARVPNAQPNYTTPRTHVCGKNGCRKHRPCEVHDEQLDGMRAIARPMMDRAMAAAKEAEATFAPAPVNRCRAARDGDCTWAVCPQEANNRANYKPSCPLWVRSEEE